MDLYPLSPIQQGMLFHWLLDPRSGTDTEQIIGDLDEEIDPEQFRRAWQRVLDRVPVLRTAFVWEGRAKPAQRIVEEAVVPFRFEDVSNLGIADAEDAIASFLEHDRSDPFDLSQAPSMRVTLFRLAAAKQGIIAGELRRLNQARGLRKRIRTERHHSLSLRERVGVRGRGSRNRFDSARSNA